MDLIHIRLACVRGADTFGLTILAKNIRHALSKAKHYLEGSGYMIYPIKEYNVTKRSA